MVTSGTFVNDAGPVPLEVVLGSLDAGRRLGCVHEAVGEAVSAVEVGLAIRAGHLRLNPVVGSPDALGQLTLGFAGRAGGDARRAPLPPRAKTRSSSAHPARSVPAAG